MVALFKSTLDSVVIIAIARHEEKELLFDGTVITYAKGGNVHFYILNAQLL